MAASPDALGARFLIEGLDAGKFQFRDLIDLKLKAKLGILFTNRPEVLARQV